MHPIDANDPIEHILITEPIDPKDRKDKVDKPAIILPKLRAANILIKLKKDEKESTDKYEYKLI